MQKHYESDILYKKGRLVIMIENVWGYKIQHDKKEPLNKYEKQKIKNSLFVGFKNGVVKKSNLTIEWKVINK